jgi:hypothetical protein
VDGVFSEMQPILTEIYAAAKEDPAIFALLFNKDINFECL